MNGQQEANNNKGKSICFDIPNLMDSLKIITAVVGGVVAVSLFVAKSNTLPHDVDMIKEDIVNVKKEINRIDTNYQVIGVEISNIKKNTDRILNIIDGKKGG
jgi:hypothetical protein